VNAVEPDTFAPNIRPDCTDELTAALGQRIMVIDGAMGTAIQRDRPDEAGYRGERFTEWPTALQGNNDLLTLTQPQIIEGIHREYLEAGADILETNTFNSNAVSLSDYDMAEHSYELNYAGAALARVDHAGACSAQARTLFPQRSGPNPLSAFAGFGRHGLLPLRGLGARLEREGPHGEEFGG